MKLPGMKNAPWVKLGDYIEVCDEKNTDNACRLMMFAELQILKDSSIQRRIWMGDLLLIFL